MDENPVRILVALQREAHGLADTLGFEKREQEDSEKKCRNENEHLHALYERGDEKEKSYGEEIEPHERNAREERPDFRSIRVYPR